MSGETKPNVSSGLRSGTDQTGEKLETVVRNYAAGLISDDESESTSVGGIRLNGDAQQMVDNRHVSNRSQKEFTRRFMMVRLMQDHIEAMQRALDLFIEATKQEIAALEVERDQTQTDLNDLRITYNAMQRELEITQAAIDSINAGIDPDLNSDGTALADVELEAVVADFERRNRAKIDRSNGALLHAALTSQRDKTQSNAIDLAAQIKDREGQLDDINAKIDQKEKDLAYAKDFKAALADISKLDDTAAREAKLQSLLDAAPDALLSALKADQDIPADLAHAFDQELAEHESSSQEDDVEAETFLASSGVQVAQIEPGASKGPKFR